MKLIFTYQELKVWLSKHLNNWDCEFEVGLGLLQPSFKVEECEFGIIDCYESIDVLFKLNCIWLLSALKFNCVCSISRSLSL